MLIVTIPFGIAALRIVLYALWRFGRTIGSNRVTPLERKHRNRRVQRLGE